MNKIKFFVLIFLIGFKCFSQNQYKKIYPFDKYQKGWALVETKNGIFGFIDKKNSVVVQTNYKK